jgi:ERCC4-type nuclease
MHISVDEREDSLFALVQRDAPAGVTVDKHVLLLGDAALLDAACGTELVIFERKTLADLAASIKDGRYAEQSHRLTHASGLHTHNIVYIIEGALPPKGAARVRALSAMVSLNAFKGFSVMRTGSTAETAELLISFASKFAKNANEGKAPRFGRAGAVTEGGAAEGTEEGEDAPAPSYTTVVKRAKKDNITPENFCEIVLAQIPGVSAGVAAMVAARAPTLTALAAALRADAKYLDGLRITTHGAAGAKTRKLGVNVRDSIARFVLAM